MPYRHEERDEETGVILMTPLEAAEYLSLDVRTIYHLARSGEIPARKVGGRWRFRKDVLDNWLSVKEPPSVEGNKKTNTKVIR